MQRASSRLTAARKSFFLSYNTTQIIYDATVRFCDRFIDGRSRTHDQMVQAARSDNKNLREGSQVSGTSKESGLKLVGVTRGSLEELLGDYEDYLRERMSRARLAARGKQRDYPRPANFTGLSTGRS